jgi:hypothetical protein
MSAGSRDPGRRGGGEGGRLEERSRKRFLVRFTINGVERTGFTKNISDRGLNIHTNQVARPGTTLPVVVRVEEGTFSLWATVVWAKKVPPELAHLLECGMGVRFIDPTPEWVEFCKRWRATR